MIDEKKLAASCEKLASLWEAFAIVGVMTPDAWKEVERAVRRARTELER